MACPVEQCKERTGGQDEQACQPLMQSAAPGCQARDAAVASGFDDTEDTDLVASSQQGTFRRRVWQHAGAGLVAAAILTGAAALCAKVDGWSGLPGPQQAGVKGQRFLEGLEELHPDLVHRLLNPDVERDVAELKQIGMGSESLVKLLIRNETQVAASMTDLRELLAERRQMQAIGGLNLTLVQENGKKNKTVRDVKCSFHAGQTVLYLVEACLAINDAAQDCPVAEKYDNAVAQQGARKGMDAKGVCAIDVMGTFAGFGWTAFFLSSIVESCAGGIIPGASCAADVTAITAALMDLGESCTGLATDCKYTGLKQTFMKAKAMKIKKNNKNAPRFGAWILCCPSYAGKLLAHACGTFHQRCDEGLPPRFR